MICEYRLPKRAKLSYLGLVLITSPTRALALVSIVPANLISMLVQSRIRWYKKAGQGPGPAYFRKIKMTHDPADF